MPEIAQSEQECDLEIEAQNSLWVLNLKDVWRYRDQL